MVCLHRVGAMRVSVILNKSMMNELIKKFNDIQTSDDKAICNLLAQTIDKVLTEAENKFGTPSLYGF